MASDEAKAWKNSRLLTQFYHMKQLSKTITATMVESLTRLLPEYDAIVTGFTTFPIAAAVANARGIPMFHLLKQPMYPTRSGSATAIPIRPQANSRLNLLARPMMLRGLWYAIGAGMQDASKRLSEPEASYSDFASAWLNTPTLTSVSPPILPPPSDYPSHVHVTGFLFLDEGSDWTPQPDLVEFLEAGEPPVYIGFGSMTGHTRENLISMLVEALDGRRGIVDGTWSREDTDRVPESVYLIDGAPHEWLFPKMSAVVHHGGSGTTAAGLRAGLPTLVIPHLFDQFYFGRRIHELGAGPDPIPRRQLNAALLKDALSRLLGDDTLRTNAEDISQRIQAEDSITNAVSALSKYLPQREKTI
jgi:UDP:flavonoid glycosyltransferase YjiC (YdhE family)